MSNLVFPTALLGAKLEALEPYDSVRVDEAASMKEARSTWSGYPRYRYKVRFESLRSDAGSRLDFQALVAFWRRHGGQLDSFLIVDPDDFQASDHGFGVGDGATTVFQLQRSRGPAGGNLYDVLGGPWPESSKPRTNLVLQSETFDNAAWTKNLATVTANADVAPDGNRTADKLVETAATGEHYAEQSVAIAASTTASQSVFAKAAERSWLYLAVVQRDASTVIGAWFNLGAGTVGTVQNGVTASIVACGNGWYRCACTASVGTGGSSPRFRAKVTTGDGVSTHAGDGTSGLLLWGAQWEAAAASTRYIGPTVAAAVTSSPAYHPAIADGFEPVVDVAPGPQIFKAGVLQLQGTDYNVAFNGGAYPTLNGAITFTAAPASGAALSWTGSFYRRVRFNAPGLSLDRLVPYIYQHQGIELVSVK